MENELAKLYAKRRWYTVLIHLKRKNLPDEKNKNLVYGNKHFL
jgi:hypothetical protein